MLKKDKNTFHVEFIFFYLVFSGKRNTLNIKSVCLLLFFFYQLKDM